VILGIRPTDVKHSLDAPPGLPRITVHADVVEELGGVSNLLFPVDAARVATDATRAALDAATDDEGTLLADDQRSRFCASIQGRHAVTVGEPVELALDNRHLHFFDAATGAAITA
jgi:multiple sugar transport system ATP-binding protein